MKNSKKTFKLILILINLVHLIYCSFSLATVQNIDNIRQHIGLKYENQANNSIYHPSYEIRLEHVEIPLTLLKSTSEISHIPNSILESLTFTRDGQIWVRWILNPANERYDYAIFRKMRDLGLSTKIQKRFIGFLTSSRSIYVFDPETNISFSLKSSTDRIFKSFQYTYNKNGRLFPKIEYRRQIDKINTFEDALSDVLASNVISKMEKKHPLKHTLFIYDLFGFGFSDSYKQALTIRSSTAIQTGEKILIPAFSILHDTLGKEIAAINNSENPVEYWQKNFVVPLAQACAEILDKLGIVLDSPHAQNVMIEFDLKLMIPTGRIAFRDLGDVIFSLHYLADMGFNLKNLNRLKKFSGRLPVEFWPLGKTLPDRNGPSWLSPDDYTNWGRTFYSTLEDELKSRQSKFLPTGAIIFGEPKFRSSYNTFFRKYYGIQNSTHLCSQIF